MKRTKRTLTIITTLVALAALAAFGIFHETQPVQATAATPPTLDECPEPDLICYKVKPSDTDGPGNDGSDNCFGDGIGCDTPDDSGDLQGNFWGESAINVEHRLYLPSASPDSGKLLVFLGGGNGGARGGDKIYPVAARQGYHVIGLTYPAAQANSCTDLDCYGNAFREVVTGENSPNPGGDKTNVGDHPQDSIVNRLLKVLEWAAANKSVDGWGRYLTADGEVDWTKIHLAGMSNGSSHVSFMGSLEEFQDIGRVALFAGPDDGSGGTTEETWDPATYIQDPHGNTGARYYGLVHRLNKAPDAAHPRLYRIARNWVTFGMEDSQERFEFDPSPGVVQDFGGAHMLISIDPLPPATNPFPIPTNAGTTAEEAHESVAQDRYCSRFELDEDSEHDRDDYKCAEFNGAPIGYEPAWRCILGTGNASVSSTPVADAGPDLRAKCRGNGGATVILDGSRSSDADCDVLGYGWTGPFGRLTGRNPTVFLPLGLNTIRLLVSDDWSQSEDTLVVNVRDRTPPLLQVTLSPDKLSPADHQMVRIHATVAASDECQNGPVSIVLTSINSSEPDGGVGNGDIPGDIQNANFGTFDQNFLLRAESFGNGRRGRIYTITYTATDASGNSKQVATTVRVLDSKGKVLIGT